MQSVEEKEIDREKKRFGAPTRIGRVVEEIEASGRVGQELLEMREKQRAERRYGMQRNEKSR